MTIGSRSARPESPLRVPLKRGTESGLHRPLSAPSINETSANLARAMENAARRSFLGLPRRRRSRRRRRKRSRVSRQVSPCRQLQGCGRRRLAPQRPFRPAPACRPESPCSLRDTGRQQPQHPAVAVLHVRPRDPCAARFDATPFVRRPRTIITSSRASVARPKISFRLQGHSGSARTRASTRPLAA